VAAGGDDGRGLLTSESVVLQLEKKVLARGANLARYSLQAGSLVVASSSRAVSAK
jgi:hypothetical protein